ncbi:flavin-containing monooxygenase [Salinisphaera aquimarina]|uniref:Flavin-containing monooxygenase n=1 Tax=Salinisphaera aquimarina TaxID=2094031 RepID=A0ABV7ELD5_9GAMM
MSAVNGHAARKTPATRKARVLDVAIIGAGFSGLGTAIRLREQGITDIAILERGDDVGGTWRDNTYPGAACDIPSNLYSFSFAQNPRWSRGYSGSAEILDYVHHLVDRFELRPLMRFRHNVKGLEFDEARGAWTISIAGKRNVHARCVVAAQGPLANPSLPDIPGIDSFGGEVIHSARWDNDYDFDGKRVAVIGTGASAIQIVPELARRVDFLKVFQRTPAWILPRLDYSAPDWNKTLFDKWPASQTAVRNALFYAHEAMATGVIWNTPVTRLLEGLAKAFLRHQVPDAWVRRQLTPQYRIGCKRLLISNDYYPALMRDNVKLYDWPIDKICEKGIRSAEGIEHQVDCIVFATGFSVPKAAAPFPITGAGGRQLDNEWARGAAAYKSVNVAGYPNLFMTLGPNAGPGHNSALAYIEPQIDYIVQGIGTILEYDLRALDVRADAQAKHNAELQKRLARTNWNSGCSSWYLTEDGFNATMYPGFATQYRAQMKAFVNADYRAIRHNAEFSRTVDA